MPLAWIQGQLEKNTDITIVNQNEPGDLCRKDSCENNQNIWHPAVNLNSSND